MTVFHIIDYPEGARRVSGTHHARDIVDVIPVACAVARGRGEYVDIEVEGRCAAVVDGAGPVHGYEGEFRIR